MLTRHNKPKVSYNEDLMQEVEDAIEEEYLDALYARTPVDATSFPTGDITWFKSNNTLNFAAGKCVVQGLGWIVHHFQDTDPYAMEDEDESWAKPETLNDVKQCIRCIYNEFESGDIVGYIDEKMYEYGEEGRTDDPLYARIDWEDILGASEEALQCDSFETMKPHIEDLLGYFCAAYLLQYNA